MSDMGVERYRAQQDAAIDEGRDGDTTAATKLIRAFLPTVSLGIVEKLSERRPGPRNMYLKLLHGVDPDLLAMITLRVLMTGLLNGARLQGLASGLGGMVEDELRFSKFEIHAPEYFNSISRDLDNRRSKQYRHRKNVLSNAMKTVVGWAPWSMETRVQVGLNLIGVAMDNTDMFERRLENGQVMIHPSDETREWVTKFDNNTGLLHPVRLPCLIEPAPWVDFQTGGYHSRRMRGKTPLVKRSWAQQNEAHRPFLESASMPTVLTAINGMQATQWAVRRPVLEVIQAVWAGDLKIALPSSEPIIPPPCPIPEGREKASMSPTEKDQFDEWKAAARNAYTRESERRIDLASASSAVHTASTMSAMDVFWIVWQLDYRGRAYSTTSGLSPQGTDIGKSLLQFSRGELLGENGWFWFRVHGANKFGKDKGKYKERVAWVDENSRFLYAAGKSPLDHADVWSECDNPWQFLSWCIEYAEALDQAGGPTMYRSFLPVALDGSCNGLQHLSAMLRDEVGGKATNLTPEDTQQDIYSEVARVTYEELRRAADENSPEGQICRNWLIYFNQKHGGEIPRSAAKKPVMTLPYGSTYRACTDSVYDWYCAQGHDFLPKGTVFRHSVVFSSVLWASIGKVVIAARAAMKWIQSVARVLAKENYPLVYKSPDGFPMVQFSAKREKVRITTQVGGRVDLVLQSELEGIDSRKAGSSASPNFTHNCDKTHMFLCVEAGVKEGIRDFAMIHDDFGVHARFVVKWHRIIREQFVRMYTENSPLDDLKQQLEDRYGVELPDVPAKGKLDIAGVLSAAYFFG